MKINLVDVPGKPVTVNSDTPITLGEAIQKAGIILEEDYQPYRFKIIESDGEIIPMLLEKSRIDINYLLSKKDGKEITIFILKRIFGG